jgi:hypothetical protein
MNYELTIDLKGADKVESILRQLRQGTNSSSGGGFNIFGSGGSNSPAAKVLSDLDRASHKVAGMKKDFQSIGTAFAQGISATSAAWMSMAANNKSASFWAKNPQFAAIIQGLGINAMSQYRNPIGPMMPAYPTSGLSLGWWGSAVLRAQAAMHQYPNAIGPGLSGYSGPTPPMLKAGAGVNLGQLPFIGKFLTIMGGAALVTEGFTKALQAARDTISRGFGIYSGAGQAGLSQGFFARRQALAGILGVQGDPQKIFMFGNAVQQISQRINDSVNILAKNSSTMAQLHINFDVLKIDFEALLSNILTRLVPAINIFLAAMDALVKKMQSWANVIAAIAIVAARTELIIAMSYMKDFMKQMKEFSAVAPKLPLLMRQLPASSMEKMGLLIGGGLQNPMIREQIKSNQYLKVIADHVSGRAIPRTGMPYAGQFGMTARTNQP